MLFGHAISERVLNFPQGSTGTDYKLVSLGFLVR